MEISKFGARVIDTTIIGLAIGLSVGLFNWNNAKNKKMLETIAQLPTTNVVAKIELVASDMYGALVDTNQYSHYGLDTQFEIDNPQKKTYYLPAKGTNIFRYDPKFSPKKNISIFGL